MFTIPSHGWFMALLYPHSTSQIPTQAEVLAMARGQGASTLAKILLRIVDAPARAAAQPRSEAFAEGFSMFLIRNI